jgi:hypothetical protein
MAFESFMIGLVEEIAFDSYTSSTNNILKRFLEDNGGIPLVVLAKILCVSLLPFHCFVCSFLYCPYI